MQLRINPQSLGHRATLSARLADVAHLNVLQESLSVWLVNEYGTLAAQSNITLDPAAMSTSHGGGPTGMAETGESGSALVAVLAVAAVFLCLVSLSLVLYWRGRCLCISSIRKVHPELTIKPQFPTIAWAEKVQERMSFKMEKHINFRMSRLSRAAHEQSEPQRTMTGIGGSGANTKGHCWIGVMCGCSPPGCCYRVDTLEDSAQPAPTLSRVEPDQEHGGKTIA